MRRVALSMAMMLLAILVVSGQAWSQETPVVVPDAGPTPEESGLDERLPQEGSFHIDARPWMLVNISSRLIELNDDAEDELRQYVSNSLPGFKFGYLFAGRHDVGAHFYTSALWTQSYYRPGGDQDNQTDTQTSSASSRFLPYYNYNFHPSNWVMPYVGPVLGVASTIFEFTDHENEDVNYKVTDMTLLGGVEGGVKLFPFPHVAFDLGALLAAGPTWRITEYNDDSRDDEDWAGHEIVFDAYVGVNVYF